MISFTKDSLRSDLPTRIWMQGEIIRQFH